MHALNNNNNMEKIQIIISKSKTTTKTIIQINFFFFHHNCHKSKNENVFIISTKISNWCLKIMYLNSVYEFILQRVVYILKNVIYDEENIFCSMLLLPIYVTVIVMIPRAFYNHEFWTYLIKHIQKCVLSISQ